MHTRFAVILVPLLVILAGCAQKETLVMPPEESSPATSEYGMAREGEGVRVISVTAIPQIVKAGDSVELVVDYHLGPAHSTDVDVRETIEVRYDGVLMSMPTYTQSAPPGGRESKFRLIVPSDAKSGTYEVSADVSTDTGEDSGVGTFNVR